MSGNRLRVRQALRLILVLSLVLGQACVLTTPNANSRPVSSQAQRKYDLAGVWTGTSITGCTPLRMNGPWRCGARGDILLTFIQEDTAGILGIFASERGQANDAFQETGRIVEVPVGDSMNLWFRVAMGNHSSCLFNANLQREEMGGSYICFRDGPSFERGRWIAQRSY